MNDPKPLHFGLIHGGMHGAWCWGLLVPELERLGHRATAVDLPCEDISLGALEQARLVAEAFAELPPEIILVSHSIGALVGALVPKFRSVGGSVFLCSPLPDIGRSLVDQLLNDGVSVIDTLDSAQLDAAGRTLLALQGDENPDQRRDRLWFRVGLPLRPVFSLDPY